MASRELTPEFEERAENFARQLQEDWDNRFILETSNILEHYLRFRLNLWELYTIVAKTNLMD